MRAFSLEGPVFGPALFHFVAGDPSRRLPAYARAPIGYGARPVLRTDPARVTTRRTVRTSVQHRKPRRTRTPMYAAFVGTLLLGVAAVGIGASSDPRAFMSRATYMQLRHGVEAETRLTLAECRALEGLAKEVCRAKVRADDRVRKAELEARYLGTMAALQDVQEAKARGTYEIAKAGCGDTSGVERALCLRNARTERAKSLAEAKASAT
jgi:hypothetical protein